MVKILKDELSFYINKEYNLNLAKMAFENGLFENVEEAYCIFKYAEHKLFDEIECTNNKLKKLIK